MRISRISALLAAGAIMFLSCTELPEENNGNNGNPKSKTFVA